MVMQFIAHPKKRKMLKNDKLPVGARAACHHLQDHILHHWSVSQAVIPEGHVFFLMSKTPGVDQSMNCLNVLQQHMFDNDANQQTKPSS